MGVPTTAVSYTSATTGRGYHEVYKGHVVALGRTLKKARQSGHTAHLVETEIIRSILAESLERRTDNKIETGW
jgi:hypothetical protein